MCHPLLSCLPSRFPDVRSLYGVFRLYLASLATTVVLAPITAPFLLLALRSVVFLAFFFRISRFRASFGLSWNFLFSSWASPFGLPSLLRLPLLLPGDLPCGSGLQPSCSADPCCVSLGGFLSVAAVLCLLLPPAKGVVGFCCAS